MSRTYRRVSAGFKFYQAMNVINDKQNSHRDLQKDDVELVNHFFNDRKLKYFVNKCGCWFCTPSKDKKVVIKNMLMKHIEKENFQELFDIEKE